ncbi:MAG: acyltransferase [Actinomycetes bacterium]
MTASTSAPDLALNIRGRSVPALDGIRALAVLAVLAYHLDFSWAHGGYLGVDLFFTLSGFLITTLLLEERIAEGKISAPAFWARRARRLLPALLVLLIGVMCAAVIVTRFFPHSGLPINMLGLRGDALATLFYVANWHFIATGQSYFAQFNAPSLLEHSWSLAIEEQFYVVWPVLVMLLFSFAKRSWRRIGLCISLAAALGSSLLMALLYHQGQDPMRAYFGTDSHAMGLLLGASLAFLTAGIAQAGLLRRWIALGAWVGMIGLGVGLAIAGNSNQQPQPWMFRGGFALAAVFGVLVLNDARQHEQSSLSKLLSVRPLRYIGAISYGVYLYHWPIFVLMTPERMGFGGWGLILIKLAATFGLSALSFRFIEQPLRRASYAGRRRLVLPLALCALLGLIFVAALPSVDFSTKQANKAQAPSHQLQAPGVGGYGNQQPIKLGFKPSPSHPLKVMSIGDSIIETAQPGIGAALHATGAASFAPAAFPGWGLTVDHQWRDHVGGALASNQPDLVIGSWTWDNELALSHPKRYEQMLEDVVKFVTAGPQGAKGMIFLQDPIFGPSQIAGAKPAPAGFRDLKALAAWGKVAQAVTRAMPGKAMFLPLGASVLKDGSFAYWMPPARQGKAAKSTWLRIRMVDGVHFCPSGAVLYANALAADFHQLFGLARPQGTWWVGDWTKSSVFTQEGLVACPDDHPPA